uniref:FYVE-type domain-containing protein n=1 Tax=Spongospora subterranea TaxID=70186 RepID=A0A0H5R882_9EUKA|eukprot:CRZ09917.1 hypothetical protein [Spongospora subterranea]
MASTGDHHEQPIYQCCVTIGADPSCECRVYQQALHIIGHNLSPVAFTPSIYIDEYGVANGFVIGDHDKIITSMTCDNPNELPLLISAVVDALCQIHENQADISSSTSLGFRHQVHRGTLHSACHLQDTARLELLLKETASYSIDRQDVDGRSALHIACMQDFKFGIEMLVKAGADPALADTNDITPVYISSSLGHANSLTFMLLSAESIIPAEFSSNAASPLWAAACSGLPRSGACIQILLQQGFKGDITVDGMNILHQSALKGRADAMEALLVAGNLDPNVVSQSGFTPLHYSVMSATTDDPSVVKLLLYAGAFPNYPSDDEHKNTPLHLCKWEEIAMALVSYGARTDMVNSSGQPAISQLSEDFGNRLTSTATIRWKLKREVSILTAPSAAYIDGTCCRLCKAGFLPLIGRKHHCRLCGNLVCETCSQKRVNYSNQAHRACDGCFNKAIEAIVTFSMVSCSSPMLESPPNELLESPSVSARNSPNPLAPLIESAVIDPSSLSRSALDSLHTRGIVLNEVQDKSEMLRNNAEEFSSLAEKLARKFGGNK